MAPTLFNRKLPLHGSPPNYPSLEICLELRSRPGLSQTLVRHEQSAASRANFPGDGNNFYPPLSVAPFSSEGLDGKQGLLVTPTHPRWVCDDRTSNWAAPADARTVEMSMLEWMTTDAPPALLLEMLVVFARHSPLAAVDTI
jgi:hypothetical protein